MSGRKCLACSPRKCRVGWLYVIEDTRSGIVKIGQTVNWARRMASYRANASDHMVPRYKRKAGCEFTSADREARAHRKLDMTAVHVRGEWYDTTVEWAIEVVENVCKGVKP